METINHEYYVSLETAKLLKEVGFDWEGMSYYQNGIFYRYSVNREQIVIMNQNSAPDYMEQYSAPTLDVAQRWLREVKCIEVNALCVYIKHIRKYSYTVFIKEYEHEIIDEGFDTYEEAQEAGIKKAIEIILKKGE